MTEALVIAQIEEVINEGRRFVLTTHVNPDGDAIGSEIALAHHLRSRGKEATILNSSPTPRFYRFLDPEGEIRIFKRERDLEVLRTADAFFILDISDWERLREVGKVMREMATLRVCIDHHPAPDKLAHIMWIDPGASATGELIYKLVRQTGGRLEGKVGEALYAAILADTGSFRFSNTTANAHRVAAELIEAGVKPHRIYHEVYERNSRARVRLMGLALSNLQYEREGRLAWFAITKKMLEETGATPQDTESLAEFPRSIDQVQASVMFMEVNNGRVKVSLRSQEGLVVNEVAQRLGGGGHPQAAGALIEGDLNSVIGKVLGEMRKLFE